MNVAEVIANPLLRKLIEERNDSGYEQHLHAFVFGYPPRVAEVTPRGRSRS